MFKILPTTTTRAEVQAAEVVVQIVEAVVEASEDMEVEVNNIGIKEVNGIKDITETPRYHEIHHHHHIRLTVQTNLQITRLIIPLGPAQFLKQ